MSDRSPEIRHDVIHVFRCQCAVVEVKSPKGIIGYKMRRFPSCRKVHILPDDEV